MYICSHMLNVPILPMYLLSVSVYSCMIFIWDMKQTDVGGTEGCNFKITFDYIYPFFFKTYFKNVSKMCSANYEFNIPDLPCLKPLQGSHYSLLPSISKHLENSLYYPHFKNEFVCFSV